MVATTSLEVGYDDPEVGAVLQHKAPTMWPSSSNDEVGPAACRTRDLGQWLSCLTTAATGLVPGLRESARPRPAR